MTLLQFATICPQLSPLKAAAYLPHFVQAMAEADITTTAREACFIAQQAHESAEFQIWREVWGPTPDQTHYERPKLPDGTLTPLVPTGQGLKIPVWQQLGNLFEGDGKRFRGRGPLQTTGRDEYKACGRALGLDLIQDPDILAGPIAQHDPGPGFRASAWYWRSRNLNGYADRGDFVGLTRAINGGTNGLAERERYWAVAKQVLGVEEA